MSASTYTLLGGRLNLLDEGPRTTEDALWLAAAIPQLPTGSAVLEAGCGNGAAGLALLIRQPHLHLTGVEIDPTLTAHANTNAKINHANFKAISANITTFTTQAPFAAAFCNPPFHAQKRGHTTASAAKSRAKSLPENMLTTWLTALHNLTTAQAPLILITHSACRAEIEAFAQTHPCAATFTPLQSSANRPPKRLLTHLQKGQPFSVHQNPPLTTYQPELRHRILQNGEAL